MINTLKSTLLFKSFSVRIQINFYLKTSVKTFIKAIVKNSKYVFTKDFISNQFCSFELSMHQISILGRFPKDHVTLKT